MAYVGEGLCRSAPWTAPRAAGTMLRKGTGCQEKQRGPGTGWAGSSCGLHRCRDAGQPAACRMTAGRDEHPHPARAPLSRDAGQVGKCTGLKEEVAGETPAQGLPGQCLCEDKQRENPLGQCMPKAPAESQLLCLAVLQAVGHSSCIETARRMGSLMPWSKAPPVGTAVGGQMPCPSLGGHF